MSTNEKITTNCPKCKAQLQVASKHAGRSLRCPKCQAVVIVPEVNADLQPPELPDDLDPSVYQDVGPKQFVVRYAPDVVSQPMLFDELVKALADGELLSEMLFAEVGSEDWEPLTFVSPRPQKQRGRRIRFQNRLIHQYNRNVVLRFVCFVLIIIGIVIGFLSNSTGPSDAFLARIIAATMISGGVWGLIFVWVNCFFQEVLLLLRRIADYEDEDEDE